MSTTQKSIPTINITYYGENGDGWVPKSQRDIWNYGVRTGQIVVPSLDDGGEYTGKSVDTGDTLKVTFIPPEYADRLRPAEAPVQPTYFEFKDTPKEFTDE